MSDMLPHISVCICTYKRPDLLRRLLCDLNTQATGGLFTYSIVVVDNDHNQSAKAIVAELAAGSAAQIAYCVESRQGIAMARNCAVSNAKGEFVAFIDDDEFPIKEWLLHLFTTWEKYHVDGVLGPVKPHFNADAPQWVIEAGLFDRPLHPTGLSLAWSQCRTGNVLLKKELFAGATPFRPECLNGEDQDFFKRMIETGRSFIWCNEAIAYEVVPPARWKRSFLVRRALFRGVFSLRNYSFSFRRVLQSALAVPAYALALPVALLTGQARFMRYVFKMSYHVGRLLAVVGINPIKGQYVTD